MRYYRWLLIILVGAALFGFGLLLGMETGRESPALIGEWEKSYYLDNLERARDSHQRAYDSNNVYWMPLSKQLEWVEFYDQLSSVVERMETQGR
ncbi:hypothetical protein LCGC14_0744810 [marine sediment metagenome]|uniref:Uncharacterized protein n=1 Tax=marine sediment metagenome TaxID=412755 RepID=A0A0F9Q9X4_9ZZZZ